MPHSNGQILIRNIPYAHIVEMNLHQTNLSNTRRPRKMQNKQKKKKFEINQLLLSMGYVIIYIRTMEGTHAEEAARLTTKCSH